MFYLIGIIIIFFLASILVSKKNKSEADKILAIWLFFIGIHLSLFYGHSEGNYLNFPYFLGFELPLPFVHGPFLFLYTALLTNQSKIKIHSWLHFFPVLLTYGYFAPFYFSSNLDKIEVYQNGGLMYEKSLEILLIFIIISGVVYVVAASLLLIYHKKNIAAEFSYTEKINLDWLKYLILGIGLIWVIIIFGNDNLIFSAIVLYVIFIGYFGIKQVGVFTQVHISQLKKYPETEIQEIIDFESAQSNQKEGSEPNLNLNSDPNSTKYQKSSLTEIQIQEIHIKLSQSMQGKKIFKDPELTLLSLATLLDVHPNNLSQVINSVEGKNFYDYINYQRVQEFKRTVLDPGNRKFTMLSLAFECGFNSKTSFNRNFKKVTNQSPSEFLNQIKANLQEKPS